MICRVAVRSSPRLHLPAQSHSQARRLDVRRTRTARHPLLGKAPTLARTWNGDRDGDWEEIESLTDVDITTWEALDVLTEEELLEEETLLQVLSLLTLLSTAGITLCVSSSTKDRSGTFRN